MNHKKIENSLRSAINQTPTVDFEKLAAMPFVKMTNHDHITMQQKNRKPNTIRKFSLAASFCLVMLVCFSGWFMQNRMPDSIISLDVNPSIEIVTNMQNKVLTVKALNEDAQAVVGDHDYNNADLSETVDTLFTSMIRQGYLTSDKNTIMISVENKNIKKAGSLSLQLDKEIQKSVLPYNITPLILRQVFEKDAEASAIAGKYGISAGKARLIEEMISSGTKLSFEALAKMSMEDLVEMTKEYAMDLQNFVQFDDDSDISQKDESALPVNTDKDHDSECLDEPEEKKASKEPNGQDEDSADQTDDQEDKDLTDQTDDQDGEDSADQTDDQEDEDSEDQTDGQEENSNDTDTDSSESDMEPQDINRDSGNKSDDHE